MRSNSLAVCPLDGTLQSGLVNCKFLWCVISLSGPAWCVAVCFLDVSRCDRVRCSRYRGIEIGIIGYCCGVTAGLFEC